MNARSAATWQRISIMAKATYTNTGSLLATITSHFGGKRKSKCRLPQMKFIRSKNKIMTHPNIDLEKLTAKLESVGFEAITKLQFRRGFVDVRIVNGLIPDNIDFVPEVFFQVTVNNGDVEGKFICQIDQFFVD